MNQAERELFFKEEELNYPLKDKPAYSFPQPMPPWLPSALLPGAAFLHCLPNLYPVSALDLQSVPVSSLIP